MLTNDVVDNLELESVLQSKLVEVVGFNPWGFSRLGIQNQIKTTLEEKCIIKKGDVIIICLLPHFFGRRSEIALCAARELYPENKVIGARHAELISLLNNPSIQ